MPCTPTRRSALDQQRIADQLRSGEALGSGQTNQPIPYLNYRLEGPGCCGGNAHQKAVPVEQRFRSTRKDDADDHWE
eukprot:5731183-Pyramimonas_sp.AAC.2